MSVTRRFRIRHFTRNCRDMAVAVNNTCLSMVYLFSCQVKKLLKDIVTLAEGFGLDASAFGGKAALSGKTGHMQQIFIRRDLVLHRSSCCISKTRSFYRLFSLTCFSIVTWSNWKGFVQRIFAKILAFGVCLIGFYPSKYRSRCPPKARCHFLSH